MLSLNFGSAFLPAERYQPQHLPGLPGRRLLPIERRNDPCAQRIISTTTDARLFALDARTGAICPGFGTGGYVDLRQGMGLVPQGFHFITSQPMVIRDRIILSGWVYDNQSEGEHSGVIRAFDARSGKLSRAWDIGCADPTSPSKPGEIFTRGTPNGWGAYTADDRLGMVHVPLGNATPDYWGARRRPFDETYFSAIVALDLETGKVRWHFQTAHHNVWDFDLPIAGSLVDLPGGVPALVQTTKRGELFLLDRRTGRPIAEVVEKPARRNRFGAIISRRPNPIRSACRRLRPPT